MIRWRENADWLFAGAVIQASHLELSGGGELLSPHLHPYLHPYPPVIHTCIHTFFLTLIHTQASSLDACGRMLPARRDRKLRHAWSALLEWRSWHGPFRASKADGERLRQRLQVERVVSAAGGAFRGCQS